MIPSKGSLTCRSFLWRRIPSKAVGQRDRRRTKVDRDLIRGWPFEVDVFWQSTFELATRERKSQSKRSQHDWFTQSNAKGHDAIQSPPRCAGQPRHFSPRKSRTCSNLHGRGSSAPPRFRIAGELPSPLYGESGEGAKSAGAATFAIPSIVRAPAARSTPPAFPIERLSCL